MDCVQHTTPTQIAAHQDHVARLARIEARAFSPRPVPPPAPPMPVPQPVCTANDNPLPLPRPKYPSVEEIIAACSRHYRVSRIDIKSQRRTANIVRPRQVAMYLARHLTLRSLPDIARRIGGRDHTTAISGIRKIERLVRTDAAVAHDIAMIEMELRAC